MPPIVHTTGLTKRYGITTALDALDLDIDEGVVFGLLGPNGTGKTRTIRLLLGLSRPTSGSASIAGSIRGRTRSRSTDWSRSYLAKRRCGPSSPAAR